MKVDIIIPKADKGEFSKIKLCYENSDGQYIQVLLNIDFKNLYMFTKQTSGIGVDLFLIGCIVYGIDVLLPREKFSINGWSREIEVEFPVESPEIFNNGKTVLEKLLSFLTGDDWTVSFVQRNVQSIYKFKGRQVYKDSYRISHKKISLFSGGLDSLIGVIDQLTSSDDRIVLVSHYDAVFKGMKLDQDKLKKILLKKHKHYHLLQTRVDLSCSDQNGDERENESSLRSRSFLFLCQAIFVANAIGNNIDVLIPENGTISLNHPLTPSRRSSCSTRTSHPYYLSKVAEFISILGLQHSIQNEYEMKTTGEMMEECKNRELLLVAYKSSCSCAKRGHKVHWEVRTATHCGICMPCIYRRVALNKIGIDNECVGTDLFNSKKALNELPDIPAFLDYMRQPFSIEDIEKNLLVNGTLPLDKIREYADVVYRTRNEIKEWIKANGSDDIKKVLGL
jgi:7-cyano-7-deazaguanine synthase in queuosine biosynthesis